jgi:phage terminase large subunit GpA-like protein
MHFPTDRDINYFAQLTAERVIVKVSGGQKYRVWDLPPGRANEALDCRVYAYAALCGLSHLGLKLNVTADEVKAAHTPLPYVPLAPATEAPPEAVEATGSARGPSIKVVGSEPSGASRTSQLA